MIIKSRSDGGSSNFNIWWYSLVFHLLPPQFFTLGLFSITCVSSKNYLTYKRTCSDCKVVSGIPLLFILIPCTGNTWSGTTQSSSSYASSFYSLVKGSEESTVSLFLLIDYCSFPLEQKNRNTWWHNCDHCHLVYFWKVLLISTPLHLPEKLWRDGIIESHWMPRESLFCPLYDVVSTVWGGDINSEHTPAT